MRQRHVKTHSRAERKRIIITQECASPQLWCCADRGTPGSLTQRRSRRWRIRLGSHPAGEEVLHASVKCCYKYFKLGVFRSAGVKENLQEIMLKLGNLLVISSNCFVHKFTFSSTKVIAFSMLELKYAFFFFKSKVVHQRLCSISTSYRFHCLSQSCGVRQDLKLRAFSVMKVVNLILTSP